MGAACIPLWIIFLQLGACSHYSYSIARNNLEQPKFWEHTDFRGRLHKIPSQSDLVRYWNCKPTPQSLTWSLNSHWRPGNVLYQQRFHPQLCRTVTCWFVNLWSSPFYLCAEKFSLWGNEVCAAQSCYTRLSETLRSRYLLCELCRNQGIQRIKSVNKKLIIA